MVSGFASIANSIRVALERYIGDLTGQRIRLKVRICLNVGPPLLCIMSGYLLGCGRIDECNEGYRVDDVDWSICLEGHFYNSPVIVEIDDSKVYRFLADNEGIVASSGHCIKIDKESCTVRLLNWFERCQYREVKACGVRRVSFIVSGKKYDLILDSLSRYSRIFIGDDGGFRITTDTVPNKRALM